MWCLSMYYNSHLIPNCISIITIDKKNNSRIEVETKLLINAWYLKIEEYTDVKELASVLCGVDEFEGVKGEAAVEAYLVEEN